MNNKSATKSKHDHSEAISHGQSSQQKGEAMGNGTVFLQITVYGYLLNGGVSIVENAGVRLPVNEYIATASMVERATGEEHKSVTWHKKVEMEKNGHLIVAVGAGYRIADYL